MICLHDACAARQVAVLRLLEVRVELLLVHWISCVAIRSSSYCAELFRLILTSWHLCCR